MLTYITTEDNPWNPFENFKEWYAYDMIKGYNTCGRLARIAPISDVLPDKINKESLDEAMNRLIKDGAMDKQGNLIKYKKISKKQTKNSD